MPATEAERLAEAIMEAAAPKIKAAIADKRDYATVWTFDDGARATDKAAFEIVKERVTKMGYSAYLGIDGDGDYTVSNREFVVVDRLLRR
jgi:hypothetical protein